MQFRDLQKQYEVLKPEMDAAMIAVASGAHFISGEQVKTLEERLAAYVGRKHCITCGNGTDALELCMMAWGVGPGDAVFVPDFTFFASGEAVSTMGGTPVFYDVCADTFNADAKSLEAAIEAVIAEGKLTPKAVVDVDLFGLPADHEAVAAVCKKHGLLFLEDAAQGFGGHAARQAQRRFRRRGMHVLLPRKAPRLLRRRRRGVHRLRRNGGHDPLPLRPRQGLF